MKNKKRKGITLVEIMVAAVLVVIAILGAMAFRYLTALDAKKADMQIGGSRVGLLLLEGWKGHAGDITYDPTDEFSSGIVIVNVGSNGPAIPTDFTAMGTGAYYEIIENGLYYYATLCYKTETTTTNPNTELRQLNVGVGWLPWGQQGNPADMIQDIKFSTFVNVRN